MIEVDIIKRKRSGDTAVNGGVQNGTTVVGGNGEAQHAINADEAAHAQRADESAHASSAKELDGGSSVWNTIRAWIANANESLKDVFLRKDIFIESSQIYKCFFTVFRMQKKNRLLVLVLNMILKLYIIV